MAPRRPERAHWHQEGRVALRGPTGTERVHWHQEGRVALRGPSGIERTHCHREGSLALCTQLAVTICFVTYAEISNAL